MKGYGGGMKGGMKGGSKGGKTPKTQNNSTGGNRRCLSKKGSYDK